MRQPPAFSFQWRRTIWKNWNTLAIVCETLLNMLNNLLNLWTPFLFHSSCKGCKTENNYGIEDKCHWPISAQCGKLETLGILWLRDSSVSLFRNMRVSKLSRFVTSYLGLYFQDHLFQVLQRSDSGVIMVNILLKSAK